MDPKIKADELPSQAQCLYIKLYCDRKGEKTKKTIQEAKKSWKSLSYSKKKPFYKITAEKKILQHSHSLSKTEVYLKEKFPRPHNIRFNKPQIIQDQGVPAISNNDNIVMENGSRSSVREDLMESDSNTELIYDNNLSSTEIKQDNCENLEDNFESPISNEPIEINESNVEDALDTTQTINSNEDSTIVIPLEPAPPSVKLGRELYDLVKAPGDKSWVETTAKEKSHYYSAVRMIKQEYIKNYTKYLESLTQQQLFDHYMKTMY